MFQDEAVAAEIEAKSMERERKEIKTEEVGVENTVIVLKIKK
jgi:hypothetical protein